MLCTLLGGILSLTFSLAHILLFVPTIPSLPISERGKFVKSGVTTTQRVYVFWQKWNEMQHFLKSQLFPTCFIRVKHAKWACNILTFVPCGIWGHKCPACHNTHLHSACKTGPSPGELTSLIRNSGWPGDRLPNVTELISPALLHIGLDLLHPPTSLQVSKPLHPCPNRWQTIQCHSPRDGNKAAKELSQAGRQRGEPWRSPLEILKLGIRTTWIWILALTLIHYKTLDKLLNNSEPQFPSLEKGIMPGNAYYTAVVMIKWYT